LYDYATLTKPVVNVPTEADKLYVSVSGTKYFVQNGNAGIATKPGFLATRQDPKYASAELNAAYSDVWTELNEEINLVGSNFNLNVVLYDETEDYRDTDLKYPFLKRKNELGTFTVDLADTNYETFTTYFKKSEVCEDKPNYSFIKDTEIDKEDPSFISPKVCLYRKIKQSKVV
jgi:hypothetical protein